MQSLRRKYILDRSSCICICNSIRSCLFSFWSVIYLFFYLKFYNFVDSLIFYLVSFQTHSGTALRIKFGDSFRGAENQVHWFGEKISIFQDSEELLKKCEVLFQRALRSSAVKKTLWS